MNIKRILIFTITILVLFSMSAFSQYAWFYGKNKVLSHKFNWQYIETEHFNIYYYTTDKKLASKLARAAEHGYEKISNYINVKVKRKIPLIFFSTHIDFELNNIAGYLPPGVIAFAESTNYRVVIQGDASFEDLSETITHELGHIFEYEIIGGRSIMFNPPPGWVMEGFSDFVTGTWNPFDMLTVRDAVLNEQVPQVQKNGHIAGGGRVNYNFGHAMFEFLEEKFGRRGIKKFLYSLKRGSFFRGRRQILKVFDYSPKLFNYEFGKYLRKRFKKFMTKENPADYSYVIGPDFPYGYSFSHDLSPSGEMVAVLTVNYKLGSLDIILISLKEGKVLKRITPGFTYKYDYINLKFNPSDGNSFTWNKNSDTIGFFARKAWKNYLVLINILDKKIVRKIQIDDIQDPASPRFHPTKNVIYFTGQDTTKAHIYSIDLDTKKVTKLTDDRLFIKAIDISSDGNKMVYSAQEKEFLKLYLAPIENLNLAKKITDGDYNDITPLFTKDGKRIFYSSDELGSYNINAIDLEAKTLSRYTDVRTGNFFPVPIPDEKNEIVISTFYKNRFTLYRKDIGTVLEKRTIEFEDFKVAAAKEEPKDDIKIVEKGKYKPFKKIFVKSLPPIGISVGTDGGFFGYSSLTLTDLMGDHNLSAFIYSYYGYRSYQMTYLNLRNRLQFYARLFTFKDAYYPYAPVTYRYYQTIRSIYGAETGFFYPFSREYRAEATVSIYHRNEDYDNLFLGVNLPYGQFFDGMATSVRFSLVGDTIRFANYGPNRGSTFKVSFEKYVKMGSKFMDAYSITADFRKYLRLDNYSLFAFRLSGFTSGGDNPLLTWTGGNNTFRSSDFRRLVGNNYFLFNAEFRFPIVHLALTPIGLVGPVRGVFFFDIGGIWYNGEKFRFLDEGQGLKLRDGRASYGFGIEFFLFGYPMHIDWIWKTDLTRKKYYGASFWIGFDF
ncbi:MAG: BamA/TamA family outer membrane protein [bacterium]|nr:BamA/TamA family outer membrane protein [bacterium]